MGLLFFIYVFFIHVHFSSNAKGLEQGLGVLP